MGQRNKDDIRKKTVLDILEKAYPDATTELVHKNPYELLIATMLSAQTTDRQVNRVTPGLFKRFPDAKALAEADIGEIESVKPIFMCNFLGNIFVSLRSRLNISVYAAKAGLIGERAAW